MATEQVVVVNQAGQVTSTTTREVSPEKVNADTIAERLDQSLAGMSAHVARGTFTSAQRDAALLLVLRVCIGLVRLVRNRLDGTD